MKNIWILNHYAITPDMPGGTRHYDFGKELVRRDYKVTIFASSFHYSRHKELKLNKDEKWKVENIDGVNFVWVKTFPYQKNNWKRVINMLSFASQVYWVGKTIVKEKNKIEKPDIIIGSSVHLLTVLSAYFLARHFKAKFVMEVRDLWPQSLIDIGRLKKNNLIAIILKALEKFLFQKSKAIIILSPLVRDYLASLGIKQKNIYLIPNGVEVSKYKITEIIKEGGGFRVVYTGSVGVVNDLDQALQAIKIIQEKEFGGIKFVFIGSGVEKERLIKKSEELGILKSVEFLDPVSKKRMPDILAQADLCLLVENKILYGSSNKLKDYMAAAKPIVFSTFAKHNILNDANCGLSVSPNNPQALAEAIIKSYQMDSKERNKMGENGRIYVEKHYNIPVLVNELEKALNSI